MTTSTPDRRCKAHSSRTGAPCKLPAIKGGTVCQVHGGRAPQVKAKAEERLRALQDPAITAIEEAFDAEVKGEVDYATRLRAAQTVLDRTGLGPTSKQEVTLTAQEQLAQIIGALDGG
jgi:hypothetical protein